MKLIWRCYVYLLKSLATLSSTMKTLTPQSWKLFSYRKTSVLTYKYLQFSALISLINDPAGTSGYLYIKMVIIAGY